MATNSFFENQRRTIFTNTVSDTITFLKKARNDAITSKSINMTISGVNQKKVPPGGYGIFIDNTGSRAVLTLFSDIWNEEKLAAVDIEEYQDIGGVQQKVYPDRIFTDETNKDLTQEILQFHEKIGIKSIELIDTNGTTIIPDVEKVSVIFEPPFADVFIADNDGNTDFLEIKLTIENLFEVQADQEKTIYLNKISGFPTTDFSE